MEKEPSSKSEELEQLDSAAFQLIGDPNATEIGDWQDMGAIRRAAGVGPRYLQVGAFLGLALLIGGGFWGAKQWALPIQARLDQAEEKLTKANRRIVNMTVELTRTTAQHRTLVQDYERLEKEHAEAKEVRERLEHKVLGSKAETEQFEALFKAIATQVEPEVKRRDVIISRHDRAVRVLVRGDVLFEPASAALSQSGQDILSRLSVSLRALRQKNIRIEGHSDASRIPKRMLDQFPTNWELSTARSTQVVRFFQEVSKIPGDRFMVAGFGEHRPLESNANRRGRQRNRRIEMWIEPQAR